MRLANPLPTLLVTIDCVFVLLLSTVRMRSAPVPPPSSQGKGRKERSLRAALALSRRPLVVGTTFLIICLATRVFRWCAQSRAARTACPFQRTCT
ncbi:hypothetical protein [Pandoravirus japonicus]|uniref:Uncharacterized protein n=1 Tax=Pandoravirus japonicus TaxID=2823154 RepID=A0A811BRF9_9VIRU|nr:hypothetical protein [Pandoravirus japonicus]